LKKNNEKEEDTEEEDTENLKRSKDFFGEEKQRYHELIDDI
jgi:hypothetical protein